jgi:hypothetical protein
MENLDIFNLDAEVLLNPKNQSSKGDNFYKPNPENGKDGVYKALVRLLPNIADPAKSKIQKYYVWLKDPVSGDSFPVDCPSTVGKKSILKDIYWKLKNSHSAADQELAESFSRKEDYYALIQIVKDQNQPDLEGKIMIYKFPGKINQLLEAQVKPEFGDPVIPFDLFEGKLLGLNVRKVGKWNNYDMCSFVGERCAIQIDGKPMKKTKEDMAKITEYLKTGPQNLSEFAYKDWDEETQEKVMRVIRNTVPDGRVISEVTSGVNNGGSSYKASSPQSPKQPTTPKNELDDFLNGADEGESSSPFHEEVKETKVSSDNTTKSPAKNPTKSKSSLDDLYNDL